MEISKIIINIVVFIIVLLLVVKLIIPLVGFIFKVAILGVIAIGAIWLWKKLSSNNGTE